MGNHDRAIALAARRKRRAGEELSLEEEEALKWYYKGYSKSSIKLYLRDGRDKELFQTLAERVGVTVGVWIRNMVYEGLESQKLRSEIMARHKAELMQLDVKFHIIQMEYAQMESRLSVYDHALRSEGMLSPAVEERAQAAERASMNELRNQRVMRE